jgi:hypothetical protein
MRLNAFARHDKTQGPGSPDSDDSSRGERLRVFLCFIIETAKEDLPSRRTA